MRRKKNWISEVEKETTWSVPTGVSVLFLQISSPHLKYVYSNIAKCHTTRAASKRGRFGNTAASAGSLSLHSAARRRWTTSFFSGSWENKDQPPFILQGMSFKVPKLLEFYCCKLWLFQIQSIKQTHKTCCLSYCEDNCCDMIVDVPIKYISFWSFIVANSNHCKYRSLLQLWITLLGQNVLVCCYLSRRNSTVKFW